MKFLVDAQLPKALAEFLCIKDYTAIHTPDLPDKNKTTDKQVIEIAKKEDYKVITKDEDFLKSYLLKNEPEKLVLVKTGNIPNPELLKIFAEHIFGDRKNIFRKCIN